MEKIKRQILSALLKEPQSFWRLITLQDGHLALFTSVMRTMKEDGLLDWGETYLRLTREGEKIAAEMNLKPREEIICSCCQGKGVAREGIFDEVYQRMKEFKERRPEAISQFDQGPVDLETLIARLMTMYYRGDLENRRLLVLGDDDLTGLAAALTGLPEKITVLEVDKRIVDFTLKTAHQESLQGLEAVCYDAREPLPDHIIDSFDTFFVDPVETVKGILLFINRCAKSLKGEGAAGYFGLTHLEASRKKWHLLQRKFLEMNLVITDINRNFQWYELPREKFIESEYPLVKDAPGKLPVPKINWYSSDLYRLEAVEFPRETALEIPEGRELYFDEEAYATLP